MSVKHMQNIPGKGLPVDFLAVQCVNQMAPASMSIIYGHGSFSVSRPDSV